jgi:hypothetical protein
MNRSCTRINLQNSLRVSQESAEQSKVEAAPISIVSSRRTTSKTASRQPTRVRTCTTQDGDIIEQPATPFIEKAEMQGILPSRRSTTVRVSRQPTEVLPTDDDLYKVPPPVPPRAATRVSRQPTRVPTAVGETVEAGEPAPAPRRATTRISKKPTPSLTTSEYTFESLPTVHGYEIAYVSEEATPILSPSQPEESDVGPVSRAASESRGNTSFPAGDGFLLGSSTPGISRIRYCRCQCGKMRRAASRFYKSTAD